jgi:hypothetical protein
MSTRLLGRVRRLENGRPRLPPPEECPRPMVGACIDAGAPLPDAADVVPCKNCSGRHVQIVHEIIVEAGPPRPPPQAGA